MNIEVTTGMAGEFVLCYLLLMWRPSVAQRSTFHAEVRVAKIRARAEAGFILSR